MAGDLGGEVAELLQAMIRNACVNDGTPESGHEQRNADLLRDLLEGRGLDMELYEPLPGRTSLVAKLEGRDPDAPASGASRAHRCRPRQRRGLAPRPLRWGDHRRRGVGTRCGGHAEPHGVDGGVGRAIWPTKDSAPKATSCSSASPTRRPSGSHGAQWLTEHRAEEVRCDYLITEAGGFPMASPGGVRLPVITGEKGAFWCTMTVRGTPGHASQPLRTDNALVKAAEVVRRLAEHETPADIHEAWRRFVEGIGLPAEFSGPLLDPERIGEFCETLPLLGLARQAHACTHTTMAPTVLQAGTKVNVIPDRVHLQVDIRTLPGLGPARGRGHDRRRPGRPGRRRRADLEQHRRGQHVRRPTPRCGTPSNAWPRPRTPTPGACPSSPWAPPTPASSGGSAPSPTASASSVSNCRSSSTRRCSTAWTSGSTSPRSGSPPSLWDGLARQSLR